MRNYVSLEDTINALITLYVLSLGILAQRAITIYTQLDQIAALTFASPTHPLWPLFGNHGEGKAHSLYLVRGALENKRMQRKRR